MDTPDNDGQASTEDLVFVSDAMRRAGESEIRDHSHGGCLRELASAVYMAMEYQRRSDDQALGSLDETGHVLKREISDGEG